jgi:hypothetical protein
MPTLLVDCPYTHRKFSTGVETTAREHARLMEGAARSELSPLP